jgi:uncharacterized protein involved in exopolysaccharide biosynthesis
MTTGETTLRAVLGMMRPRWRMIAACALIGGLTAFAAAHAARPRYRAEATIYALSYQGNTVSGALRALDLGGGMGQLLSQGATSETASYLVSILRSHAIADTVSRELDLARRHDFAPARPVGAWALAETLRRQVTARGDFSGLITITAIAPSAQLAGDIANAYVGALDDFMSSSARGKRRFIERQLREARTHLVTLERDLQSYQTSHGSYALEVEAQEMIRNWAQASAEQAAAQVALRENAGVTQVSGSIDDLVALRSRRAGLQARSQELQRLVERLQQRLSTLPQVGLGLARLQRRVALKQALVEMLESQLQLVRIAEVEEQTRYQVLDRAHPPARPVWPRRKLSALAGAAAGLLLGLLGAYVLGMRQEATDGAI